MLIHIESAVRGDIPALVALLGELFSIESDFVSDTTKQERGLSLLLDHPDRAVILVARAESGVAIGMVSAQLVISTAEGGPSVWIEDMIIGQQHRRRGLGKALLQAALDWAAGRGATRAQLLVDTGNDPALAYYEQLGWTSTSLQARRRHIRAGR